MCHISQVCNCSAKGSNSSFLRKVNIILVFSNLFQDYKSTCSVLFHNNTIATVPKLDSCKKAEVVEAWYQFHNPSNLNIPKKLDHFECQTSLHCISKRSSFLGNCWHSFVKIEPSSFQCLCACKRCSFCKQDLIRACPDNQDDADCFDNVLNDIITNNKCD